MRPALPALFGCAPLGRSTASVEALTSFLARLCRRRSVRISDVVDRVLRPHAPSGCFPTHSVLPAHLHSSAASFDSLGARASVMVSAMETVTMRVDLRVHTLLPFARLFDYPDNVSPSVRHRRWCPCCFADAERKGLPRYEPLLWRIPAVTHCSVHHTALVECCPRCGARQGSIAMRVPIGFCRGCGHRLDTFGDVAVRDISALADDERWACARAAAIGRMLVAASDAVPSRQGFRSLLADTIARSEAAGLTQGTLGLLLGLGRQSFSPLCDGSGFPLLHHYVGLCLQLGADPADVMMPGFEFHQRSWPPSGDAFLSDVGDPWTFAHRARERAFERTHPQCALEFDRLAAAPLASPMGAVAKAFGINLEALRRQSPLRWARLRAARAAHITALRAAARERARNALEKAIAAGGEVTGFMAGRWACMTESGLAEHCPDLYARLRALVEARVLSRDPAFVRRAQAALDAALCTPRGVTANAVARSLGTTRSLLLRACPDAHRRLIDLRREERQAVRAAVRAGLEAELARPAPRGTCVLARALGVTTSDLNRQGALNKRYIEKRRVVAEERAQAAERKRAAARPSRTRTACSCRAPWRCVPRRARSSYASFSACAAPRAGS